MHSPEALVRKLRSYIEGAQGAHLEGALDLKQLLERIFQGLKVAGVCGTVCKNCLEQPLATENRLLLRHRC